MLIKFFHDQYCDARVVSRDDAPDFRVVSVLGIYHGAQICAAVESMDQLDLVGCTVGGGYRAVDRFHSLLLTEAVEIYFNEWSRHVNEVILSWGAWVGESANHRDVHESQGRSF